VRLTSLLVAAPLALSALGCRDPEPDPAAAEASAEPPPSGSLGPPETAPPPKKGMVFVPGGALVAGTAPDSFPRIADEEIPGEQVILRGFYIDVFPYPNEEGAIPLTNVTQAEARGLCEEHGKRLCSELEWERACKGPKNTRYEYGDAYRPDRCGTGSPPSMRPSGFKVGCRSEFGVHDLHGGVWEWTDSPWGRTVDRDLAALRGGNAAAGELVGRCANAMGRPPTTKSGSIGFRCCSGPRNDPEVVLHVERGKKLEFRDTVDKKLAKLIAAQLPEEAKKEIGTLDKIVFERSWIWRPIGNEELYVIGGCAGLGIEPSCGIAISRIHLDRPTLVGWASSGHWAPTLHGDTDPRDLWLFGGDDLGQFKRLVAYVWGKLSVGPKERRMPKPKKKTTKKKR
jgi:formylglycine-generating enzyme required for sulfatase activity